MSIYQKIFRKLKKLTAKLENIKNTALRPIYRAKPEFKKISKLLELIHITQINQQEVDKLLGEPLNISEEQIRDLLEKGMKYRVLNDSQPQDRRFLEKLGISSEYLEMNTKPIDKTGVVEPIELTETENIYYKSAALYQDCLGFRYHLQENHERIKAYLACSTKIALEEGLIYAICPMTGQLLSSNCSFPNGMTCFYRFVGKEVFYLALSGKFVNAKNFIYVPKFKIIIELNKVIVDSNHREIINKFNFDLIKFSKDVIKYVETEKKLKTALIQCFEEYIGHDLLNNLSGVEALQNSIMKTDKILVKGKQLYGRIDKIFPEFVGKNIEIIPDNDETNLLLKILSENLFVFKINHFEYVTEKLATRIYTHAKRECSVDFLNHLEQVRNRHFPLIFITWRLHRRRWLSQIEGVTNIINTLAQSYPNLGIIFDGFSRISSEEDSPELIQAIQKEKEAVQKVANAVNPKIQIYNSIGYTVQESILWASIIDFYFAAVGSGFIKTVWINNKPGIAHEPHKLPFWFLFMSKQDETVKQDERESAYFGETNIFPWRENCKMPLCIPKSFITDYPDGVNSDWFTTNYDFDWRVAYKEILRLISLLEPRQVK